MCAKLVSNVSDYPYSGRLLMKTLYLLGVKRFSFTSMRYDMITLHWLRFSYFRFDTRANTSFVSVCSAGQLDGPESKVL